MKRQKMDASGKPILDAQGQPIYEEVAEPEKKFLGKFKDEADATESLKQLEQRLTDLAEDNKFMQDELEKRDQALETLKRSTSQAASGAGRSEVDDPFALTQEEQQSLQKDPAKVFKSFGQRLYKKATDDVSGSTANATKVREYADSIRNQFYTENKDLAGHEIIVGGISALIQAENPRTPPHMLLGKVAERAREYIKKIKGDGGDRGTYTEGDQTRGSHKKEESESKKELDKSVAFKEGRPI